MDLLDEVYAEHAAGMLPPRPVSFGVAPMMQTQSGTMGGSPGMVMHGQAVHATQPAGQTMTSSTSTPMTSSTSTPMLHPMSPMPPLHYTLPLSGTSAVGRHSGGGGGGGGGWSNFGTAMSMFLRA